jgi:hypothetical protein
MPWAVWVNNETDDRHVVPVLADGAVKPPHNVMRPCPCQPHRDVDDPKIVIHEQIQ